MFPDHYFVSFSIRGSTCIVTRPQTKLRESNNFTPVCDSVHRRNLSSGGSLSKGGLCPGGALSSGGRLCRGRGVLRQGDPPYGKERPVRILLECILILNCLCLRQSLECPEFSEICDQIVGLKFECFSYCHFDKSLTHVCNEIKFQCM